MSSCLARSGLSETNLGSRDEKPVQEIETTGVGEELTRCLKHPCFRTRMIRPVVGGGGGTYLKQPPEFRRLQFVEPVENQGI